MRKQCRVKKDLNSPSEGHGERAANPDRVILDRNANGHRREISTGAFEPDRATAEKAFATYLTEKHVPNFGDGRPDQVLIADVLAYYGEHRATQSGAQDSLAGAIIQLGEFFAGKTVNDITPVVREVCRRGASVG